MELIIGDKLWSSWSMRPWLALKHTGASFTETLVRLRRLETEAEMTVMHGVSATPVLPK